VVFVGPERTTGLAYQIDIKAKREGGIFLEITIEDVKLFQAFG